MAFTLGYRPVADAGVPRTFTAVAREDITAGQFVFASGANNVVDSNGVSSLVSSDVKVATGASGLQFNGIATSSATSGNYLSVATRGLFIVGAEGAVTAGFPVMTGGAHGVLNCAATDAKAIGRALTSAGSEGYCVIQLGGMV